MQLDLDDVDGMILNVEHWGMLWNTKHWFNIRKHDDGSFYNLDSVLESAQLIGDTAACRQFLTQTLEGDPKSQLLTIHWIPVEELGANNEGCC